MNIEKLNQSVFKEPKLSESITPLEWMGVEYAIDQLDNEGFMMPAADEFEKTHYQEGDRTAIIYKYTGEEWEFNGGYLLFFAVTTGGDLVAVTHDYNSAWEYHKITM